MSAEDIRDQWIRSLAGAVARGLSVEAWARQRDVSIERAREFAERPEFPGLVEQCRAEQAERTAGKIARAAAKAMDRLVKDAENSGPGSASVETVKALLEKWVELSANLEQGKKLDALAERVKIIEESRATHVRAMMGNSEN